MTKVFVDTNIVFSFWKAYISNNFQFNVTTFADDTKISRMISRYTVYEMKTVCLRENIFWDDVIFVKMTQVLSLIYRSGKASNPSDITSIVYDPKDQQIIADAIFLDCEYLLTKNRKDFNVKLLHNHYQIVLIARLSEIQ